MGTIAAGTNSQGKFPCERGLLGPIFTEHVDVVFVVQAMKDVACSWSWTASAIPRGCMIRIVEQTDLHMG